MNDRERLRAAFDRTDLATPAGLRQRAVARASSGRRESRPDRGIAYALAAGLALAVVAGLLAAGGRLHVPAASPGAPASSPASAPAGPAPAVYGGAMVYDPVRHVDVLFGGGETWIWDGGAWREQHPAHQPSRRTGAAMFFDARSGRVVLFGGRLSPPPGSFMPLIPLGDTWMWDGSDWTPVPVPSTPCCAAVGPGPAFVVVSAYDEARQVGMVIGQFGGGVQQWRWRDRGWDGPEAAPPIELAGASMAYDPASRQVVVVGGFNRQAGPATSPPGASTWTFDGTAWTRHPDSESGPAFRSVPSLASSGGSLYLFGGRLDGGAAAQFANDLWRWDGEAWTRVPAARPPVARGAGLLVAGPARGEVLILYGGMAFSPSSGDFTDSWAFDGKAWREVSAVPARTAAPGTSPGG